MSEDAKNSIGYGLAAIFIVIAIGAGIWVAGQAIGGVGNWWSSIHYTSPEEQAQRAATQKAYDDEWAKDPRNPKVAGQKCLDLGGIPDYSAWDGDVKECRKPGGGNIDVKQSVEVKQ